MVSLADYPGREQAYIKHIFLQRYLESLFFKTSTTYNHIVYIDGFAGPWQSANEQFEDTSFGIALNALRKAKEIRKGAGRAVKMTALLVEKDRAAHAKLATIRQRYPDITIKTYNEDFRAIVPDIVKDVPPDAFAFCLIDPKGYSIVLKQLRPLLARPKSEVVFNFMFEFINRAASMKDPITIRWLDELMPHSSWQQRLREAEEHFGRYGLSGDDRKDVIVGAFRESLRMVGGYPYVSEITVLRPRKDRPLYCLVHATRSEKGIEVFRACQVTVLKAQAEMRGASKIRHQAANSLQDELFESMLDMGPDETQRLLDDEKQKAGELVRKLAPKSPRSIFYRTLWANVLAECIVRRTDVNAICAAMKKSGELVFPDWEAGKKVPQDHYHVQRA